MQRFSTDLTRFTASGYGVVALPRGAAVHVGERVLLSDGDADVVVAVVVGTQLRLAEVQLEL